MRKEIKTLQKQALVSLLKAEILSQLEVDENEEKLYFEAEWESLQNDTNHYISIEVVFRFDEVLTPETYTQPKDVKWTNKRFEIISVDSSFDIDKYDLEKELTHVLMQW